MKLSTNNNEGLAQKRLHQQEAALLEVWLDNTLKYSGLPLNISDPELMYVNCTTLHQSPVYWKLVVAFFKLKKLSLSWHKNSWYMWLISLKKAVSLSFCLFRWIASLCFFSIELLCENCHRWKPCKLIANDPERWWTQHIKGCKSMGFLAGNFWTWGFHKMT